MIAPIPQLAKRAEVVTICGSSKFKTEILAEVARLTIAGKLVVSLGVFGHHDLPDYNWDTDASDLKTMLDALHRQKIDMADSVHVVNPGGYYGESTAREIAYARSIGKPVTFMDERDPSGHKAGDVIGGRYVLLELIAVDGVRVDSRTPDLVHGHRQDETCSRCLT